MMCFHFCIGIGGICVENIKEPSEIMFMGSQLKCLVPHDFVGYDLQVFCYALSQSDRSEWRQRISAEAEHFIDVSAMASDAIAQLICDAQIQILVNLNGYTKVSNSKSSLSEQLQILTLIEFIQLQILVLMQTCFLCTVEMYQSS